MEVLQRAINEGIQFEVNGDRLKIKSTKPIPSDLVEQLRAHKPKLIEALRKQKQADRYKPKYPPKPKDHCYACKSYDWWLSRYGVWTCRMCHPPAPGAEVGLEVYQSIAQGQNVDSRGSEKAKRRYCEGYKPARFVHPDVCKWHLEEADPKCANCQHLGRKEKELLMDSYLNKAIARLNAEGVVYYKQNDSQEKRKVIYRLEKEITATFLACDVSGFIEAVDEWQKTFNGGVS